MINTNNPIENNYNEIKTFSEIVNKHLQVKKMSQAELIRKSQLTRTTVSRICRNSNDKGSCYQPTDRVVMSICVALGLDKEETIEMFYAAFPYFPFWNEIIEKKMNIFEANELLDEQGLPLLGSQTE